MNFLLKLADYTAAVLMGLGTLIFVSAIVLEGWNSLLAMGVGMLLGTIVLVVVMILFIRVSTVFQIIPVGMPLTMIIGMTVAMKVAAGWTDIISMVPAVVGFSLFIQFGMNQYNNKLKGDVQLGNGN